MSITTNEAEKQPISALRQTIWEFDMIRPASYRDMWEPVIKQHIGRVTRLEIHDERQPIPLLDLDFWETDIPVKRLETHDEKQSNLAPYTDTQESVVSIKHHIGRVTRLEIHDERQPIPLLDPDFWETYNPVKRLKTYDENQLIPLLDLDFWETDIPVKRVKRLETHDEKQPIPALDRDI